MLKSSVFTGRYIFDEIVRLENELKELDNACALVIDQMGENSIAHKLLDEQYNSKKRELNSKLITEYSISRTLPLDGFINNKRDDINGNN